MNEPLTALLEALGLPPWNTGLVFFRISAAMALLPAFGERTVPVRVKLALAIALTLATAPLVELQAPSQPVGTLGMAVPILAETVCGLALGFSLRLFVVALQMAGAIAAQSTSLSQVFATAGGDPLPAIGHLLSSAGLALLMITGFHVQLVGFLAQSYVLFPAGQFPSPGLIGDWTSGQVSRAFRLAFQISAPFVILSLLYNVMLGFINRAMPQLMVAFVGAPLITLGSLILLFLTAPAMLSVWQDTLQTFLSNPGVGG